MKALTLTLLLIVLLSVPGAAFGITHAGVKVYLAPQGGFETYLAAAFSKKHVPVTLLSEAGDADYVLESVPVDHRPESTGSKVARCLFAYCAGIQGTESVSVRVVDTKTGQTVWAYTVNKGHQREQSLAEAVAKHFKSEFIDR